MTSFTGTIIWTWTFECIRMLIVNVYHNVTHKCRFRWRWNMFNWLDMVQRWLVYWWITFSWLDDLRSSKSSIFRSCFTSAVAGIQSRIRMSICREPSMKCLLHNREYLFAVHRFHWWHGSLRFTNISHWLRMLLSDGNGKSRNGGAHVHLSVSLRQPCVSHWSRLHLFSW